MPEPEKRRLSPDLSARLKTWESNPCCWLPRGVPPKCWPNTLKRRHLPSTNAFTASARMPITNRNSRSTSTPNAGRCSSSTRLRCFRTTRRAEPFSAADRCFRTSWSMSAAAADAVWCWSATARSCRPSGPISARRSTRCRWMPTAASSTARWTRWCGRRRSRASSSTPRWCAACSKTAFTRFPASRWIFPTSRRSWAASSSKNFRIAMPDTAATRRSSSRARTSGPTATTRASAATCSMPRRRSRAATC